MEWRAQGIHRIDTGLHRPGFDAAWLVVEGKRAVFIDCGTSHAVPAMLKALEAVGLGPEAVERVILTHVHLDHAGGVGALLERLPNARVGVHPRGARHLINPARLVESATAVYGEGDMARHYGTIVPVPAHRLDEIADSQTLLLGERELFCLHTPGHAEHHLCIWDARSHSWFTGDTFGISYRELDGPNGAFIIPTTSPTQFDPMSLKTSITQMMSYRPRAMHLTHYGTVTEPVRLAASLLAQIEDIAGLALRETHTANRENVLHRVLSGYWQECAVAAGLDAQRVMEVLAIDIRLNAQGLVCWLERIKR